MPSNKFNKTDVVIIVIFFALYMIGYAWMIEPKKKSYKKKDMVTHQTMSPQSSIELKKPKLLTPEWPEDLGKYFYWIDIERGYDQKAILQQMQEVRARGINQGFDEVSYFQDHYDEYLDDPEDEIRFPPEIFDANDE